MLVGTRLAHYRILAKLGAGGMGEVYLALDERLERKVALKVLPAALASDPEGLRRLEREAKALAALDHPHIVPVHSFESAGATRFLTMAYVEGHSLDQLIPERGFPLERLLDLAVALADALRAAHQHGIVHRDLKPANVMIDAEGRVRVLDFGLAKRDSRAGADAARATTELLAPTMTREGTILGTYPYMSPEQAEGRAVDARSDLFSFGVMLYELTCGRRPFVGDTGISLITSILRDRPTPLAAWRPTLPVRLAEIVERCLEKQPDARYPNADALRADLEALRGEVARGTAVYAPPEAPTVIEGAPPPVAPTAPRRFRRPVVAVAVAALVVAAALAAWRLWPREHATASLAVLPFANAAGEPDLDYLCDGLTEGLISELQTLPSLRVSPLAAVLHFKGKPVDPRDAGRKLGTALVATGTLERRGTRLVAIAELVESERGTLRWSGSFERAQGELLALQEELGAAIAGSARAAQLTGAERERLVRRPTADGEAYDLYLQARHLQRRGTEDDYLEAVELLGRATVRDPRFAQAYLNLAGIHAGMVIDGYLRPTDGWALANRAMRQALALDPDLPDAPAIRHGLAFFFDWDWSGAELERERFLRAQVGEFTPDVLRTFSFELLALGRLDEALALARRARELDPLSAVLAMLEADYLVRGGELDAAVALYRRAIELEPDNPAPQFGLAEALFQKGSFAEAIQARRQAHAAAGDDAMARLFAAARGAEGYRQADREWVRAQLVALEARSTWAYVSPLDFARAYAQLGEVERAFEFLDKAFVDRSPGLVLLRMDRAWDAVRGDPRFAAAIRRVGLPEASPLTGG